MPTQLDDALVRLDHLPAGRIEVEPTRIMVNRRWVGPALGVIVAIVSFGFGGSLAGKQSAEPVPEMSAATPGPRQVDTGEVGSIVVQVDDGASVSRLTLELRVHPSELELDALVDGAVASVGIRVTDRDGHVLATSTVQARTLPSVLVSSPSGNGMAVITTTLPCWQEPSPSTACSWNSPTR